MTMMDKRKIESVSEEKERSSGAGITSSFPNMMSNICPLPIHFQYSFLISLPLSLFPTHCLLLSFSLSLIMILLTLSFFILFHLHLPCNSLLAFNIWFSLHAHCVSLAIFNV